MSDFPSLLADAFWAAAEATSQDESVHGMDIPYFDREMNMVDTSGSGMPKQFWAHLADAWREACTIRTVEQLDALPDDAVIRDRDGIVLGRNPTGIYPSQGRPWWPLSSYSAMDRDHGVDEESIPLPALLIWHPDWEQP